MFRSFASYALQETAVAEEAIDVVAGMIHLGR